MLEGSTLTLNIQKDLILIESAHLQANGILKLVPVWMCQGYMFACQFLLLDF